MKRKPTKKILICHFRVGKTDGVSIEIESWRKILEREGFEIALCSGPVNLGAKYIIQDLETQLNEVMFQIDNNSFGGLKDYSDDEDFNREFRNKQKSIENNFRSIIKDFKPDAIIASNMFAVGEGVPIAGAFVQVLDEYEIPTILIHHDFYWENVRYKIPTNQMITNELEKYFPPKRKYIQHFCINSIGQNALLEKKKIAANILYDTFDYSMKPWSRTPKTTKFLKEKGINSQDIFILQATRVVRRKNIELAIDLVRELNHNKEKLRGELYGGRNFDPDRNNIVLVLSGYVEKRDEKYLEDLLEHAYEQNVKIVYLGDQIHKKYELFDIYPYADIITYPSEYEGFGNQLLEAFFARKPVVLFEYPVFKSDIKAKGFQFISLGDQINKEEKNGLVKVPQDTLKDVAKKVIKIIKDSNKYKDVCSNNFETAASNFSFDTARKTLLEAINKS